MIILKRKELILVGVTYYLPDYQNLLNEFYCQFEDITPDIPRVHQFLNYWKNNVEAIIKTVEITTTNNMNRNSFFYKVIN